MKKLFIYIFSILLFNMTKAQVPVPAAPQSEAIALKGGTAHIGNGEVIENSIIGFDKGKITFVSTAITDLDLSGYKTIDITGQHVYPGFILLNSSLGLSEISAVDATDDRDEVGKYAPNVRSQIAYNTDSKIIPTFRYNGILAAETTPEGGTISGTSSLMNLDGWNWEDATLKADIAIHMSWPNHITSKFDFATYSFKREPNKEYNEQVSDLVEFIREAKSYSELANKEVNLKLKAMQGLFDGSQVLMIHAENELDIIDAVKYTKENGIKRVAIIAGIQTIGVSKLLADNDIPVILPAIHDLPDFDDEDVYLTHKLPGLLNKAGVKVVLSHNGMLARGRNLPFYAGTAVAYNVEKEEAIKMITSNPAEVLGLSDELGTLEKGKRATLFVSEGDALNMMSNKLTEAYIDGKQIILENEQQMLFKRYSEKYGSK